MWKWNAPIITVQRVGGGSFPLDDCLGLERGRLSPALARSVVWLSGLVAYEQVSQVLARIGPYSVPPSTLWEPVQPHGERLGSTRFGSKSGGIERTAWESRRYQPQLRKGVSLDGGMVNIRGEGWKESRRRGQYALATRPQGEKQLMPDARRCTTRRSYSVDNLLSPCGLSPTAGSCRPRGGHCRWCLVIWTLATDRFPVI
jgi:hypothetical protein